jgi:hypothetical protein
VSWLCPGEILAQEARRRTFHWVGLASPGKAPARALAVTAGRNRSGRPARTGHATCKDRSARLIVFDTAALVTSGSRARRFITSLRNCDRSRGGSSLAALTIMLTVRRKGWPDKDRSLFASPIPGMSGVEWMAENIAAFVEPLGLAHLLGPSLGVVTGRAQRSELLETGERITAVLDRLAMINRNRRLNFAVLQTRFAKRIRLQLLFAHSLPPLCRVWPFGHASPNQGVHVDHRRRACCNTDRHRESEQWVDAAGRLTL